MAIRKKSDDVRINERIRSSTVRLISAEGEQLGLLPVRDAIRIAREEGLDLVEVAPNADPPVCRVMDYGKFRYQTAKKVQEARKKSRGGQMKEIKLRPHTEDHDLGFKIKNLKKFLDKRHRVKVTVFFRGREMAYMNAGVDLLKRVAEEVSEVGSVEQPPTREARNRMTMVIIPK
ncbi:MAG: translation initiation factor IF-3 [Deltaproteobacteria bacterium]|nr:translation initiation factor IF-3 [Deltaproteobacteria bacterium]MBW2048318.1 translation initiation factor IF-3 [Deltaproteobacteria bacterium]MBW2110347.1 translation initiation factor IF-3 [Deltaproteobacteria bacterium]MBW2353046.1 translation initiation factor IF-3 [Deltaproteobacteria bacterium]HDZ90302.1 translation initiation factor IF-3 [Deltaproteobacteria bacterium]